ncbi:MAG: hypothetical protein IJE45_02935 [Bacilli bacterium]|nr:hypothetical protein [Bacilli bacterium]
MDENKDEQQEELTEKQKELIKKIEETEDSEELMKLIEELNAESENVKVQVRPVIVHGGKRFFLFTIIESLVLGLILLGLTFLFNPFRIINPIGLYIYIGITIISQTLLTILIRLIKHPIVLLFSGLIINLIMFFVMIISALVLSKWIYSSGGDLLALVLFSLIIKHLFMTTVKKILRG